LVPAPFLFCDVAQRPESDHSWNQELTPRLKPKGQTMLLTAVLWQSRRIRLPILKPISSDFRLAFVMLAAACVWNLFAEEAFAGPKPNMGILKALPQFVAIVLAIFSKLAGIGAIVASVIWFAQVKDEATAYMSAFASFIGGAWESYAWFGWPWSTAVVPEFSFLRLLGVILFGAIGFLAFVIIAEVMEPKALEKIFANDKAAESTTSGQNAVKQQGNPVAFKGGLLMAAGGLAIGFYWAMSKPSPPAKPDPVVVYKKVQKVGVIFIDADVSCTVKNQGAAGSVHITATLRQLRQLPVALWTRQTDVWMEPGEQVSRTFRFEEYDNGLISDDDVTIVVKPNVEGSR